jgi:DNA repair protein RecO (recombination protein O)
MGSSMLIKTEAIVLKSMKYRDTSKIVTFYSKEYGKLKGIAKGARTAKNKFGSALEPMTRSMLVLYKKEHRELHLISQCDAIDSFKNLSENLDRMTTAFAMIELLNQVTHDEERHPALYALIDESLSALNSSVKNYSSYYHAFRLRLATLFGYAPNFEVCSECGKPLLMDQGEKEFAFQMAHGAVVCNHCRMPEHTSAGVKNYTGGESSITAQGLQIVRRLVHARMESVSNLEFDVQTGNQIDELLRLYLRYHFEGLKPSKSTELFHQYNKASITKEEPVCQRSQ